MGSVLPADWETSQGYKGRNLETLGLFKDGLVLSDHESGCSQVLGEVQAKADLEMGIHGACARNIDRVEVGPSSISHAHLEAHIEIAYQSLCRVIAAIIAKH